MAIRTIQKQGCETVGQVIGGVAMTTSIPRSNGYLESSNSAPIPIAISAATSHTSENPSSPRIPETLADPPCMHTSLPRRYRPVRHQLVELDAERFGNRTGVHQRQVVSPVLHVTDAVAADSRHVTKLLLGQVSLTAIVSHPRTESRQYLAHDAGECRRLSWIGLPNLRGAGRQPKRNLNSHSWETAPYE